MSSKKVRLPKGFQRRGAEVCHKITIDGKRYSFYGRTVQEVQEKEALRRQEIKEGSYRRGVGLTVESYGERWIEGKRGSVKETTLRTDLILLRVATGVVLSDGRRFGDLKLREVETSHVREVQRRIKKNRTTRTTNDTIAILRGMFRAAMAERICAWNPAAGVKLLRRTETPAREGKHRALTVQETEKFLRAARESFYYYLFVLLLNTGLRIGEAGALTPRDITPSGAQVTKTITRTEVGGYKIGEDTKTAAGRRTVPLNAAAKEAVRQEMAKQGGTVEISKPIFRAKLGTLLQSYGVNLEIKKICARANIEPFTAHAFRDTFATRCVESGMTVKVLQEIMGHTDVKMTLGLYAHAMDETKAEQLEEVNFGTK